MIEEVAEAQNRITEYRRMLQAWRSVGVITYAGYILGFPADTPESIACDIRIIQQELPIDMLHFFVLTPLPGSKDHQALFLNGARLDPDLNRYDTEHATTDHPRMSAEDWEGIYKRVWPLYYSPGHIETLLKRAAATGISSRELATTIFHYYASQTFEGVHPLQAGVIRRKLRTQRRGLFPLESPVIFYPRRLKEIFSTYVPALWFLWRLNRLRKRIERHPKAKSYTDIGIAPVAEDDDSTLELYQQTEAARQAVANSRAHATSVAKAGKRTPMPRVTEPAIGNRPSE
jgi:hypothetical protein